jgi:hypothetical protein
MFTDYSLNLGSYEVMYMYANMDKPDNQPAYIYTHHKKVSTSLTFYNDSYIGTYHA